MRPLINFLRKAKFYTCGSTEDHLIRLNIKNLITKKNKKINFKILKELYFFLTKSTSSSTIMMIASTATTNRYVDKELTVD